MYIPHLHTNIYTHFTSVLFNICIFKWILKSSFLQQWLQGNNFSPNRIFHTISNIPCYKLYTIPHAINNTKSYINYTIPHTTSIIPYLTLILFTVSQYQIPYHTSLNTQYPTILYSTVATPITAVECLMIEGCVMSAIWKYKNPIYTSRGKDLLGEIIVLNVSGE